MDPARFPLRHASPRGFALAYVREGAGVPLLLIHGWPETLRIWWRNIEPLAGAGFDVIAPDLRGFGESEIGPDGYCDVVSHALDLYALVHDQLGIDSVVVAAGDLGGAVAQDLAMRFPGFVERLVIFNAPLPYLKDGMRDLRTRPDPERFAYFLRQGNEADALAAELETPAKRRAYISQFYADGGWAAPGAFSAEDIGFHASPFEVAAKLRASFGVYESALHEGARIARPIWGENPTPTQILHGGADPVCAPDFDRMACVVFPDHAEPVRIDGVGHFVQWEAAPRLETVLREFCAERLAEAAEPAPGEDAAVSLGSNLGPREAHLVRAIAALRRTPELRVTAVSPPYETDPVGPPPQGPYLNQALRLRTRLSPQALLECLQAIEMRAGRTRGPERNTARTLDLDLLFHGATELDDPGLCIPHPRLHERAFVLTPLRDVAPDWRHPRLGESVAELARRQEDPVGVRLRGVDQFSDK